MSILLTALPIIFAGPQRVGQKVDFTTGGGFSRIFLGRTDFFAIFAFCNVCAAFLSTRGTP